MWSKNINKKRISLYLPLFLIFYSTYTYSAPDISLTNEGKVPGTPFEALQQQVDDLQIQINTIQTTPGPQGPEGPQGIQGIAGDNDAADGVEITFLREFQFDPGTGPVPALDLNGTNLFVNGANPTVTLGGQVRNVLVTKSIPNTNPSLQQVIVDLPNFILAGQHKLKLTNAQGNSEVFAHLSEVIPADLHDGSKWIQATSSASWSNRKQHTVLNYNNKMWVMGGNKSTNSKLSDVWYSTDGITWAQATASAAWDIRARHSSVVYDDKMWMIGGITSSGVKNDVWYSTDGITWTQATASAAWPSRYDHTSVVYDGKMWVMGGLDNNTNRINDVWYSTDGITWTQATANADWSARFGHTSVAYDNKMWILGGQDGFDKDDVWLSTDGVTWTEVNGSVAWSARSHHTSLTYDNKMWVIAGTGGGVATDNVWHSSDGMTWTKATEFPGWSNRFDHASVVYNGRMWLMGGNPSATTPLNDVWSTSE